MQTRMEKYYDNQNGNTTLRQHKNENLYENINSLEVEENYRPLNNATVLDDDAKNIDVGQIKKILDTKYNKEPKRRSIMVEENSEEPNINLENTREYDINAVLEQAKNEKEDDYEKERVKKVRDTQFDILNSLDFKEEQEEKEKYSSIPQKNSKEFDTASLKQESKQDNAELLNLINTITMHEIDLKNIKNNSSSTEEINPLDILTDLKGTEDTIIINGLKEEESVNETSPIMSLDDIEKTPKTKEITKTNIVNTSTLSNTLTFTQSDFDDFNDLKKEVKSSKALIYVAIILVSLVLIAGLVIFLNKFLNLSLF